MKVVHKKLGRQGARGQAHCDEGLIEIDPRLQKKEYLEILIHEALHLLYPSLSETKIIQHSKKLATVLWKQGFRKCDT